MANDLWMNVRTATASLGDFANEWLVRDIGYLKKKYARNDKISKLEVFMRAIEEPLATLQA